MEITEILIFIVFGFALYIVYLLVSRKIKMLENTWENYQVANNEFLSDKFEEMKSEIETVGNNFLKSQKNSMLRHKLKSELEMSCENILLNHTNLNERFKYICLAGREATKNFAEMIINTEMPLTAEIISSEAGNYFDSLKIRCNSYFPQLRWIEPFTRTEGVKMSLSKYLKEHSKIREYISQLVFRLLDAKSGKYNGKTGEKIIDAMKEFMELVIREGVNKFNEFERFELAPRD